MYDVSQSMDRVRRINRSSKLGCKRYHKGRIKIIFYKLEKWAGLLYADRTRSHLSIDPTGYSCAGTNSSDDSCESIPNRLKD